MEFKFVQTFDPYTYCIDWSPDGKFLVTGGGDHAVRFWEAHTGAPKSSTIGVMNIPVAVESVSWDPKGREFPSSLGDLRRIRTWSADGSPRRILRTDKDYLEKVRWSPDGKRLACARVKEVLIWDLQHDSPLVLGLHKRFVRGVAWNPRGDRLATIGEDQTARIWDVATRRSTVLDGHKTPHVLDVGWSPDGSELASVGLDGTMRLWQLDGSPGNVLQGDQASRLAWNPDGKLVAANGGGNLHVELWNRTDGSKRLLELSGNTTSMCWSHNGDVLATGNIHGHDGDPFRQRRFAIPQNDRMVGLYATQLTDAGLEQVTEMESLESLNIAMTDITDAGLAHSESLRNLTSLNVLDTKVTATGVVKLQRALPNCRIESDFTEQQINEATDLGRQAVEPMATYAQSR